MSTSANNEPNWDLIDLVKEDIKNHMQSIEHSNPAMEVMEEGTTHQMTIDEREQLERALRIIRKQNARVDFNRKVKAKRRARGKMAKQSRRKNR